MMNIVQATTYTKSFGIGRQGENLARQVVFDLSDWITEYCDGTPELIYQRPGDKTPYPVAAIREGSTLIWTVTSLDTAVAPSYGSYGRCELRWYVGDVLAKSQTWRVYVEPAMDTPAEMAPPDPEQGWVDQVLAAGAEAQQAAKDTKAEADRAALLAAEVAAKAAQTAQDATAGAQAKETAQTARHLAETAQRAAEKAQKVAEEAQAAAAKSATDADAAKHGAESALSDAQDAAQSAKNAADVVAPFTSLPDDVTQLKQDIAGLNIFSIKEVLEHAGCELLLNANKRFEYTDGAFETPEISFVKGSAEYQTFTVVVESLEIPNSCGGGLVVRNRNDLVSILKITEPGVYKISTDDNNGIVLRYALTSGSSGSPQTCVFKFKLYSGDLSLMKQILPDYMLGLDVVKSRINNTNGSIKGIERLAAESIRNKIYFNQGDTDGNGNKINDSKYWVHTGLLPIKIHSVKNLKIGTDYYITFFDSNKAPLLTNTNLDITYPIDALYIQIKMGSPSGITAGEAFDYIEIITEYEYIKSQIESKNARDFLSINKQAIPIVSTCFGNSAVYQPHFRCINVTDLHGTFTSLNDAFVLAQKYKGMSPSPVIINTGDMVGLMAKMDGSINPDVTNYMSKAVRYGVYHVMGQHEVGFQSRSKSQCMSHDDVFEHFISPMKTVWGLPNLTTNYYTKDINKTRLIALYQYNIPLVDDPNDSTLYKYERKVVWYGQDQIDWLINTLASTPAGFDVVILMHQTTSRVDSDGSKFFTQQVFGGSQIIDGDPIVDIVSAYMSKSSINKVYQCKDTVTYPINQFTFSAVGDFSTSKGTFRNYFCGDAHVDYVGKIASTKQRCIGLTSSGGYYQSYDCVVANPADVHDPDSSLVTVIGYASDKIMLGRIGQQYATNGTKRDIDVLR